jgi:hypothetical protein
MRDQERESSALLLFSTNQNADPIRLGARFFGFMGVADGAAQARIETRTVQDHFLRMHRLNCGERDGEVAGIFDVNDKLGTAIRNDLADGAKFLAAIGGKNLEANFNYLFQMRLSCAGP